MPASKLSTSMTDLSVSIVNRMSPLATGSPSFLSQPTMEPSSVIWPNFGMMIGVAMASVQRIETAAATTSLAFGRNAASRMWDCGAMPFFAPTRLTGASR